VQFAPFTNCPANTTDNDTDKVEHLFEELERSQHIIEKLTAELEEAKANAMESSEILYLYDELDRTEQKSSEAQKEVRAARFERGALDEIGRIQKIVDRLTEELERAKAEHEDDEILFLYD